MINPLNSYFSAEKQESVIFITVGLVAIGVSTWLWMNGHRLKSMAYPLVVIALMQMVVGVSIYLRTDHQIATLSAQLQQEPAALKAQEIPRMQTVMKNFSIYKAVEMVLLILGLGMLALRPGRPLTQRITAWVAALAVFGWIVSVAITKQPLGLLAR